MYFKNIFLLWLKLSILISKALLKEMASGEESDLAHFTGLGWAQRLAPAPRGREQRKHSRGGEENKKRRGAEELREGQKLFLHQAGRRPINP